MPTLLEVNGYRFFFYSNENNEPIHIHIGKGDAECKYWLSPEIIVAYSYGFNNREKKQILKLVKSNADSIIKRWNEFFK